ncbi:MAG: host attachment protein [Tabrizicola sp.]
MKPRQYLYLLAADQDFRLLRGSRQDLVEISHHRADAFPDVQDVFASERNRGQSPGMSHGVSFGLDDSGRHEAEERRRFARHALAALQAEWGQGKDAGIVLVAGPKMLGVLRELMPKGLGAHVTADLAKDLVKVPLHDMPGHLAEVPGV